MGWQGVSRERKVAQMAKRKQTDPHRSLRVIAVDNPYYSRAHAGAATNPRYIDAVVNVRESAITTLASRGRIDPAQEAAANKFRALWEAVGGKGASAIDYGRDHVDGGTRSDPVTERQINAADELRRAHLALGDKGYWLVSRICGEGYALHEVTQPPGSKRAKLAAAKDLRTYLDRLAAMWGLTTSRTSRKPLNT
jgi:hypothetical protein